MKSKFIPILFGIATSAAAQTSHVAPTKILSQKGYQLGVSGESFTSSKRVDKDNNKIDFNDGEGFSRFQGEVSGFYGLTENLQIGGGVRFRQNKSTFLNASSEEETDTSTGVESTFFNLIYAFKPVDRFHYVLEGTFRFRPYSNEESEGTTPGSLALGDQGNEYSGGIGVTYSSRTNNYLTGRVGYRKPGSEISSEIYWQVEGALAWTYLALVAGVDGISSMNNDPYEGDEGNRPVYNTGSTFLYNSSNRELIAPYAGVNIALGTSWRVELRGSQVVSGRSTDLGTSFGASLIRRSEDKSPNRPDKKFKQYDFEASVTKVSPKKGYVVIDRGISEDVQKGMKIDFYEYDYVGGNILLARGIVVQAKADTSIVKITQIFNTKKELKEGILARGSFR
jgi:hypothetical protein